MLQPGEAYTLEGGRIYNLRADQFIPDHSGIRNPAVAHAVLSAVAAT